MASYSEYTSTVTQVIAFEAETLVLVAEGRYTSPPSAALKGLINRTIAGLKADGVWTLADCMYVRAVHESLFACQNWVKNAHNTTVQAGSPVFTAKKGFKGDGSAALLNNNYTPSTEAVQFTRLDCSIVHMATILGTTTARIPFGAQRTTAAAKSFYLLEYTAGVNERMYLNSSTYNGNVNRAANDFIGYTRLNSTTVRGFLNGNVSGADAATSAQADPMVDRPIYELGNNNESAAYSYWNGESSFLWIGKGLSDAQHLALYNRMNYFYSNVGSTF